MNLTITKRAAHLSQYADLAYTTNATGLDGLEPILSSPPSNSGFYAAAYRDSTTGKIVVAFRGTEPLDFNDTFGADVALKNGSWHPQFDEAINFIAQIANDDRFGFKGNLEALKADVLVTGHSLGGALAQLTARLYGLDGAALDPAGAQRQTLLPEFQSAAARVGIDPNANQVSANATLNGAANDELILRMAA